MHIRVINPTITTSWEQDTLRTYQRAARPGTQVSVVTLDWGTASIECHRDEALVTPDILTKVVEAEQDGADAVIIDCMGDPGLYAARELVQIPVVGPAQASMHLAAMLGHRFSVLCLFEHDAAMTEDLVNRYGLSTRLASARAFNIPVLSLHDDVEATVQALIPVAQQAVLADGADIIVPGCTGLAGLAPRIQAGLRDLGCEVPVLDPPSVALKLAESLVDLGQAQSKRTWPYPPTKQLRWPVKDTAGS
jgi:allantoin racemase